MRVCVSDHSVSNRISRPLDTASTVTQSTWRGPLSIYSIWDDSTIEVRTFPLNTLSQSLAVDLNLLAAAAV